MGTHATVHDLAISFPAEIQDLVLQARAVILECVPGAEETVDQPGRVIGYGFGSGYSGVVCVIIPSRTGVKLGIPYSVDLPDPKRLLAGAGKMHRHVAIRAAADLDRAGIKPLLRAAHAAWKRRRREKA